MMYRSIQCFLLITSSLIWATNIFATDITYKEHAYQSGSFVIDKPFAEVKEKLLAKLANYTAADAYARYDAGELSPRPTVDSANKELRKPYKVYEVRWEVPIFLDTGDQKQVYRIGLGGGPGRHLIGQYPEAGLHILPAIHLWGEDDKTTVFFIVPSSQYENAFPDAQALGEQADARIMSLLKSLTD